MNDEVMETLKTIQWLYANTTINDDECAALKDLAFFGDPKAVEAVMKQMNEVNWLRACERLTPEELALLNQKVLGPYRERQGAARQQPAAGQQSTAGQQTVRLEQPAAPAGGGRWRHWVMPASELTGGQPLAAALQAALDEYGADGWELAGILPADGESLLVLKRAVRP